MFLQNLVSSAASALAVLSTLPIAHAGPTAGDIFPRTPAAGLDVKSLAPKLSAKAQIYYPGSSQFTQYTVRWSNLSPPTPNVVIVPGTEKDVSVIAKFANDQNVPILATTGHHGTLTTLGRMTYGINVYMPALNTISIAKDGKSVTMGGGVNSKKLIDALWAAGKQTVTGSCECVSYLGPALGGGHGWLQGHHGLITDQLLSMNIVLATGEQKTIDSKSDLWWGMQGAGHNFGIVTSVTAKIYDIVHQNWAIETIIISGDKVEQVYKLANEVFIQGGKQPTDIHNWSYWLNDPLDAEKPVITMFILQEGVDVVDPKYTKPFNDLGALASVPKSGTYRDVAGWVGIALDSPPCQDVGFNTPRFPIYTKDYNVAAMKKAYDLYASKISGANNPYSNSIFMFEDYATAAISNRANDASAYGFRDNHILAAPLIIYAPTDKAGDAAVEKIGNDLRQIIQAGTGRKDMHTYVNYAYGTEGPKQWYGPEQWRQDRLKALKMKYDPKGKFSFYAPIA